MAQQNSFYSVIELLKVNKTAQLSHLIEYQTTS
jgi:hypothetical protein